MTTASRSPNVLALIVGVASLVAAGPAGAQDTAEARAPREAAGPQELPPALDSVRANLPERLGGLDRQRSATDRDTLADGAVAVLVQAVYQGDGAAVRELLVSVSHGPGGRQAIREELADARGEAVVTESSLDGGTVFTWSMRNESRALAGLPGPYALAVAARPSESLSGAHAAGSPGDELGSAVEEVYRRLRDDVLARFASVESSALENARPSLPEGFVRSRVDWSGVTFSVLRPEDWALVDMARRTGGMLQSVVLLREPEVARERFGPDATFSTDDTVSLGSASNVTVTISATPADPAETSAEAFLRDLDDPATLARMLPGGRATGDVETRPVHRDSLAGLPFRGRDREGRRVRGSLYAFPLEGRMLEAQVMIGPAASRAAVEAARRIVASVTPEGGG